MAEFQSEETKTGAERPGFFVFQGEEKHNILCRAKNEGGFSLFFSLKLPLSPGESCGIMNPNDELYEVRYDH